MSKVNRSLGNFSEYQLIEINVGATNETRY